MCAPSSRDPGELTGEAMLMTSDSTNDTSKPTEPQIPDPYAGLNTRRYKERRIPEAFLPNLIIGAASSRDLDR
ncbi:hypothetical protein TIFTF001_044161 [Ficus carica]|uniref:Uncharacterized protein n=1 Tax=Ficus carica TaxID=3494 RepID=A0AA87ZIR7_FICCA|nr:hypothetical protein TIFTF001_044161 [Ficus carica]